MPASSGVDRLPAIEGNPRRLKNDLYSHTATRAGVCSMPQMKIPIIDENDPGALLRTQRLEKEIARQERKLARINRGSFGIGKRAVLLVPLVCC